MAASIQVSWGVNGPVLPLRFAYVDLEEYDYANYAYPLFRDMIWGLGAEGHRVIAHATNPGTPAAPVGGFKLRIDTVANMAARAAAQGRIIGIGMGAYSGPMPRPSSVDPRVVTDYDASGVASPANFIAWLKYAAALHSSLRVTWCEAYNEPGTAVDYWMQSSVSGYADRVQAAVDWCAIHMRQFMDAIAADPVLGPLTIRRNVGAGTGPYDGETLEELVGLGYINGFPFGDSNIGHATGFSDHAAYGSFRSTNSLNDRQSVLNNAVDPTWHDGASAQGAGYLGTMLRRRFLMNQNGGSAFTMEDTEWQPDGQWTQPYGRNWYRSLFQTVTYILAINYSQQLNLRSKTLMSAAIDDHGPSSLGGGLILGKEFLQPNGQEWPMTYTVAAYNLIQQIHPFVRNYKQQVSVVINGNPLTPGGTKGNPMPSIYCASGIDGQGGGGILICNIDLSNAQTVTVNLSSTPSAIKQTRLLQSDVDGSPLGSSQLPPTNQLVITLQPGEVSLFEMTGVSGGSSGATTGTLGTTSIGASYFAIPTGVKFAQKITVPANKTYRIDDIKMYVRGSSSVAGTANLKPIIWGNSSSLPANVVAVGTPKNVVGAAGGSTPTLIGFGAGNAGVVSNLSFALATGSQAGDLALLRFFARSGVTPTTPTNWTLKAGKTGASALNGVSNGVDDVYIYQKILTSGDISAGSVAVSVTGGAAYIGGRVSVWRGASDTESWVFNTDNNHDLLPPAITTLGSNRLAVLLPESAHTGNTFSTPSTGVTGGTWTEPSGAEYDSGAEVLGAFTAPIAAAGTIAGGDIAVATDAAWIVVGCAIIPSGSGSADAAAWLPFSSGLPALAAGDYWVGLISSGTDLAAEIAFDAGAAGTTQQKTDSGYNTIAVGQAFGGSPTGRTDNNSIYVDWTDVTGAAASTVESWNSIQI